jgi:hypothetical protein
MCCCPRHIPGGRDAHFSEREAQLIGLLEVSPQEVRDLLTTDGYLVTPRAKEQDVIVVTEAAGEGIGILAGVCRRPLLECRDDLFFGFVWGSHVSILVRVRDRRKQRSSRLPEMLETDAREHAL